MAVDTRERRFSMMNMTDGTNIIMLQEVDNLVDKTDRATSLDLYSGIDLGGLGGHPTMRRWGGSRWLVPGAPIFGRTW